MVSHHAARESVSCRESSHFSVTRQVRQLVTRSDATNEPISLCNQAIPFSESTDARGQAALSDPIHKRVGDTIL